MNTFALIMTILVHGAGGTSTVVIENFKSKQACEVFVAKYEEAKTKKSYTKEGNGGRVITIDTTTRLIDATCVGK